MTENQYNKACNLRSRISYLEEISNFANSNDTKFYFGIVESPDDIAVPLEDMYIISDEEVTAKYDSICAEAKREFISFVKDRLENLKTEFNNV